MGTVESWCLKQKGMISNPSRLTLEMVCAAMFKGFGAS
jgi:hypothetical protein